MRREYVENMSGKGVDHWVVVVSSGGKTLVDAAQTLKKDPYSKQGRESLIDGCKEILKGTTGLLNAYDDSEVRRIVALCEQTKRQIQDVNATTELNALIQHIRPACQSMVDLTAISSRRVDELLYVPLQDRMRKAIQTITKISNLLVTSSKAVASNPENKDAVEARSQLCTQLQFNVNEIAEVVQIREWSEGSRGDVRAVGMGGLVTSIIIELDHAPNGGATTSWRGYEFQQEGRRGWFETCIEFFCRFLRDRTDPRTQ